MNQPPASRDEACDVPSEAPVTPHDTALALLAARRALDRSLPAELIPDPALDLLLTLFTASSPDEPIANVVLGEATTVEQSVVERYLVALHGYDFVSLDVAGRRTTLTKHGAARIRAAMEAVVLSQTGDGAGPAQLPAND